MQTSTGAGLVHHLAIGRNIPLEMIAALLARLAPRAIVEFVPRGDPMVERLLASREDVFPSYTEGGFEAAFSTVFRTISHTNIAASSRSVYLFERIR